MKSLENQWKESLTCIEAAELFTKLLQSTNQEEYEDDEKGISIDYYLFVRKGQEVIVQRYSSLDEMRSKIVIECSKSQSQSQHNVEL